MATKNGATPGTWKLNFNAIKRKEKADFLAALDKAMAEKNDDLMLPYMVRVIESWEFAGDPGNLSDYENLGLEEWTEVVARFVEGFPDVESAQRRIRVSSATHGTGSTTGRSEGTDE